MKQIKILCIGNSFSEDMTYYAPLVFKRAGYKFVIGNLYIGGCTLSAHLLNSINGQPDYDFFINEGEGWSSVKDTLLNGIKKEKWDIITLQQASGFSGIAETYRANLWQLIAFVKKHAPGAKLYWHKTWSYAKDSTHPHFKYYDCNQSEMDGAIESCVQSEVIPTGDFKGIIRSGDAIISGRAEFDDSLTRDGFHMSVLGRYITALTLFFTVTGERCEEITEVPVEGLSSEEKKEAYKIAAEKATFAEEA